jgi:hypothetical protein
MMQEVTVLFMIYVLQIQTENLKQHRLMIEVSQSLSLNLNTKMNKILIMTMRMPWQKRHSTTNLQQRQRHNRS